MDKNRNKTLINGKNIEELKINQKRTIENIIKIRNEKNVSQYKLAKDIGLSRAYYCSIENGKRPVTQRYLEELAKYFDVDYSELVVYQKDYNEGFSDAITSLADFIKRDYLGLKSFVFNFYAKEGNPNYSSFLYPFLYSMGYEIYVLKSNEVWKKYKQIDYGYFNNDIAWNHYSPDEIYDDFFRENMVFLIVKNGKPFCYCSPKDFKQLEMKIKRQLESFFEGANNYISFYTLQNPIADNIITDSNCTPIEKLKKQIEEIKRFTHECEKIIEREEQNEKSKRNGDNL